MAPTTVTTNGARPRARTASITRSRTLQAPRSLTARTPAAARTETGSSRGFAAAASAECSALVHGTVGRGRQLEDDLGACPFGAAVAARAFSLAADHRDAVLRRRPSLCNL